MTIPSLLNAYHDEATKSVVLVFRSGDELRKRTVRAEHVSYLHADDVTPERERALRRDDRVRGCHRDGGWLRLVWRDVWVRREMMKYWADKTVSTYEGDVGPTMRWLVDNRATVARPRRCYLDIEADSRVSFSEKEKARILCWVVIGEDGREASAVLAEDTDDAEAELLTALWTALEPYDQVCAWYGGSDYGDDGYDFPMIRARSRETGAMPKDIRRWLWCDHLACFKRMNIGAAESGEEKQSMALQNIAVATLGYGKDDFDPSKTWAAWENNTDCQARRRGREIREACRGCRACLLRYCRQDTKLLPAIEKETGYLELFQTLCEACGVFAETRSLMPNLQVDSFMLRLGRDRDLHFSTRRYSENEEEAQPFEGAYVMEPARQGILRDVHVADFASMYPSIIIGWNMSPDTKARDVPINGPVPAGHSRAPHTRVHFRMDQKGVLPGALADILALRKEWKDKQKKLPPGTPEAHDAERRSKAYKVAANSFYGVMGLPYSRYYDREVAESISTTGAWIIKRIAEIAKQNYSIEVVYIDTDAIDGMDCEREQFAKFVDDCNKKHLPKILAELGATPTAMKLEFEKSFEWIVFVAKKRYVAKLSRFGDTLATAESKPEIKGLEYRRGDTARLARGLQLNVINLLMADQAEPAPFIELIERTRTHILDEPLPISEVAVSKALGKNLLEYAPREKKDGTAGSMLPHLELAKKLAERGVIPARKVKGKKLPGDKGYEQLLDVPKGTKIEFVVTDAIAKQTQVVWAPDYDGSCDRFYLWEKLVYPPTLRLLEAAFPTEDWKRFLKVRPKKLRGKAARAASTEQVAITFKGPTVDPKTQPGLRPTAPAMRKKRGTGELVIVYDARNKKDAKAEGMGMSALGLVLDKHPGARSVLVNVQTPDGTAALALPHKVCVTPQLFTDIRALLGSAAV